MTTIIDEETGEILEQTDDGGPDAADVDTSAEADALSADVEEDEAAPPMTEKELEAAQKKLESEATRHANRVSEIMGADAQILTPCALCEPHIPGFTLPFPIDDEKRAAVMAALGMGEAAELEADPETVMCDYCQGNGETITGSKVPNQATRPCPKCMANGWLSKEAEARAAVVAETAVVAAQVLSDLPAAPAVQYDLPNVDAWTRPKGHPNYGKNPVYMDATERAADWEGAR